MQSSQEVKQPPQHSMQVSSFWVLVYVDGVKVLGLHQTTGLPGKAKTTSVQNEPNVTMAIPLGLPLASGTTLIFLGSVPEEEDGKSLSGGDSLAGFARLYEDVHGKKHLLIFRRLHS